MAENEQAGKGTTSFGPAGTQESCAVLMLSMLGNRSGLVKAELNAPGSELRLSYDPQQLQPQEAEALARQVTDRLADTRSVCAGFRPGTRCETCAVTLSGIVARPALQAAVAGDGAIALQLGPARAHSVTVAHPLPRMEEEVAAHRPDLHQDGEEDWRPLAWAAGFSALFLALGAVADRISALPTLAALVMYSLSYVSGGYHRVKEGLQELRRGILGIDFLMILGAAGAAVLGRWEEGAILMFLFSLSAALEAFANGRTRQAIRKLMELSPDDALVRRDGREFRVAIEDLVAGDLVVVRSGERFPADGQVLKGESSVNEAAITGESMPVDKAPGSQVFAGTVNGYGVLEFAVTKPAGETTLARIIRYVEDAQTQKASTQRLTEWVDRYYTLVVIAVSGVAYLVPPMMQLDSWSHSFYRAMMLLVVASPCALVISTPAAILSGIARGARSGILFKGGLHLEQVGKIKVVAFDKTGTLTVGRPRVVAVEPQPGVEAEELIRLAAAAESRSEHPLASAILRCARDREVEYPLAEEFRVLAGRGARALVDGREVIVGSGRMLDEAGVADDHPVHQRLATLQERGWTDVAVVAEGRVLGVIAVADTLREEAADAVAALKRLGVERVVMLTGDNRRAAQTIGHEAGVDEVRAELLPEDKWRVVQQLQLEYGAVAMVGDGVNDAPALAAANVGVAMGGIGSDVAMETADVVLMADDLHKLAEAIDLGRRTRRVVMQNLSFSISVIAVLVTVVLLGHLTLPLAVVGHEGSTILVAFNGLRLLLARVARRTPPRPVPLVEQA